MKNVILIFSSILTIMFESSCTKNVDNLTTPTNFIGKWTLTEILGNDYWGGAAYWHNVNVNIKIEFTTDGKYLKKYSSDSTFTIIGTFRKLSDSTIEITQENPANPSYPSYVLNYTFSSGGYMTWGDFGYEGIIKEKYNLNK